MLVEMSELLSYSILDRIPWLAPLLYFTKLKGRVDRVVKYIDEFLDEVVNDHIAVLDNDVGAVNQDIVSILLGNLKYIQYI